ncbi:hypothetical protein GCM10023189_28420 [Nibrella saemangeumensis]|uniref:DUF4397 domain-containing protein n=1 Tax=Nibrella saemangeumensis TaxID=1084526 RepID=A0ABP8MZM0_9BACT
MKTYLNHIGTFATTGILTTALFIGCQSTEYPDPQPATGASTNQARFLFVNAAPGAPALNFLVENNQAGQSVAYGQNSTGYTAAQAGTIQLRARAASGNIGGVLGSNDILFRAGATNQNNFAAAANTNYTVFVTDTLNRPRPATSGGTNLGGPQFLVVTDNLTAPSAGNVGVRFFHLAPDAPAVSVRLQPQATGQTTPTFLNRAYRAISTGSGTTAVNFASFTQVPAGTYTVQVFTGATIPATANPALSQSVTLEAGKLYTLYARGLVRGTGGNTLGLGQIIHN